MMKATDAFIPCSFPHSRAMNALRIHTRIDSDTLRLPELRALIGQDVEIIVLATGPVRAGDDRWNALQSAAGKNLVDPNVYREYREFDALSQGTGRE
jgi:hypothetical protein